MLMSMSTTNDAAVLVDPQGVNAWFTKLISKSYCDVYRLTLLVSFQVFCAVRAWQRAITKRNRNDMHYQPSEAWGAKSYLSKQALYIYSWHAQPTDGKNLHMQPGLCKSTIYVPTHKMLEQGWAGGKILRDNFPCQ